jgi:hypothetical protein
VSTYSAKLFAQTVQGTGNVSEKLDSLAKAIIALANAVEKVEAKLDRRQK